MINALLNAMSVDMGISRFHNESDTSFAYRLCYSALGQWCLYTARNSNGDRVGTSKHNQTIVLNNLLEKYIELFPDIEGRFVDTNSQHSNIAVAIRRVYEETGYLLTDSNNYNQLANFGRSIPFGDASLFFGLSENAYTVAGLGVFTQPTAYEVSAKDFLIRDDLTCKEYFHSRFDPLDFYDRDIEVEQLEFFNPLSKNSPSQSWGKNMESEYSVARKIEPRVFYRVIKSKDGMLFADEPVEAQTDSLISYEYRRLYFALKAHYVKPLKGMIIKLDEQYSKIRVQGQLPNREYYFMLLISWPERNAFDKVCFIIRNRNLPEAITVLSNIGIEFKGGHTHA